MTFHFITLAISLRAKGEQKNENVNFHFMNLATSVHEQEKTQSIIKIIYAFCSVRTLACNNNNIAIAQRRMMIFLHYAGNIFMVFY